MKLILFVAVVMFKCSRLSSAPADLSTEVNKNDYALSQPEYVVGHPPGGLAYVSDSDDSGTVVQFRRSIRSDNNEIEARRRSALDKGFMRFGRAGNMMRFGRSPVDNTETDEPAARTRKNDKNILRFGRARGDGFMRFGRDFIDDTDADEYNDDAEGDELIERPVLRSGSNMLRFGRGSSESGSNEVPAEVSAERSEERTHDKKDKNMLRFGRAGNMLRFGRAGNMLRFGRAGNMMRFGRAGNMLRFGRSGNDMARATRANGNDRNLLRLGRAGNMLRFGRNDEKNLMRFGKRSGPQSIAASRKIYCEDGNCVVQENENQLLENDNAKSDQLQELFGNDASKQGYGEYINEK